jgi:hypothetical protein
MHTASTIEDQRELTPHERQLLDHLLHHSEFASSSYVEQLADASVVSRCSCGCPTVDLAVCGHAASLSSPTTILADGQAQTPEGVLVGVILHAREGLLSELEVYSMEGVEGSFSLPLPEAITLYTARDSIPNA